MSWLFSFSLCARREVYNSSLIVAFSDLQLDQAQASITQSILHNLETWNGIGLNQMHIWMKIRLRRFEEENKGNTGNGENNKETWIDFGKDLVGVGIESE